MAKKSQNSRLKERQARRKPGPSSRKIVTYFALGVALGALALLVYGRVGPGRSPSPSAVHAGGASPSEGRAGAGWSVGERRPNGLRIIPTGRSDASRVLDPAQFSDPEVHRAYAIAQEIPEVLNQLYCWCGCENRGIHRSNLGCFEDEMSVNCAVCRGTAEIAYALTQRGVTDAGRIQAAVDERWAPTN